jgi:hypothetical protein
MKTDYTHIFMVLDRSGSMNAIATDTIGGFNQFVKTQKAAPGHCTVTLVQFDWADGGAQVQTVFDARRVSDVPDLNGETYVPRGGTPLYDALGQSIQATGKFLKDLPDHEKPAKVVFVIITDGLENSSREYTRERVFQMIKHQREAYKWEFVFLGANQDAMAVGQSIGVAPGNSMTYEANTAGTQSAFASVATNAVRYRSSACGDMGFSKEDRDEQEKAKTKP